MTGTYRLQLHGGFTFADAEAQVGYLADLGVTALYLSPVLQAVSGSQHGYDVVDHTLINEELGGETGLRALAAEAHARGLGVVVDVVPNHVAFAAPETANPALWQVLREGRDAATAHWFDVDWEAGDGRLAVPILGAEPKHEISEGNLLVEHRGDAPVLTYHDHVLPVADGTLSDDVEELLGRQHYRLTSWREADRVLNYRRFFSITSLIAVRVELPDVFDATHALLLALNHDGVIDGFRVDHPDGLADPEGYLRRLRDAARPGTPVYVEKILQGDEHLPSSWPCEGTTGYDAARAIDLALADSSKIPVLDRSWRAMGGEPDLATVTEEAKRYVVEDVLRPEVARLARRANEELTDLAAGRLSDAISELLAACEVYRGYHDTAPAEVSAYRRVIDAAVRRARRSRPDLDAELGGLQQLATDPRSESGRDFALRLQQVWSAVMAKAVEDTAFYRWHRLVALNEVGGEPGALDDAGPETLHDWAGHQQRHWPSGMTALSTHDTKRSEDVRARIIAVAADERSWAECTAVFGQAADDLGVDRPTAHLVWQTLVGVGDVDPERIHAYLVKAVREASQNTSWSESDEAYETKVLRLADVAREPGRAWQAVQTAVVRNRERIRAMVLGQKALQLLVPGVPDVYQGTEMVDLSLVDPDNRRPVDYVVRRERLAHVSRETPLDLDDEKLLVTSRLLALREELPEAFGPRSRYAPLLEGPATIGRDAPVLGFLRGDRVACLVTRAIHDGQWLNEHVTLPSGIWRDHLTGRVISWDPAVVACSDLFARYPVAILVRDG